MCALGRHVGLLKIGISRISSASAELIFGEVVANARIARNRCILLSIGLSPVRIMFGRSDSFIALDYCSLHGSQNTNSSEVIRQRHLLGMLHARTDMAMIDADKTIAICLQKNTRYGAKQCRR